MPGSSSSGRVAAGAYRGFGNLTIVDAGMEVSYAPGESSPAHSHPGITIVYVLEGEIRSKVGDEPEHARNWRARQRAAGAGQWETAVPVAPPLETTTQAVAVLDAQFAWLRGAEKPGRQRRAGLPNSAQR